MLFHRIRLLASFLCIAAPLPVVCQTAPEAGLPADPAALLSLGRAKNGLGSADVVPWHIRANYTLYGSNGKPEDRGVYEEWWVSATQYKRSFTSSRLAQTDYAIGGRLFRAGAQEWLISLISLRTIVIEPLPEVPSGGFTVMGSSLRAGGAKLACASLTYDLSPSASAMKNYYPTYCFDSTLPELRISSTGGLDETVYNQIVIFQGHYLAREISFSIAGKPKFDLSVDVVERMPQTAAAFFDPPPDAKPVDLTSISFPAGDTAFGPWLLLKRVVPSYPPAGKTWRIRGTVIIEATIDKDGHVGKMKVTEGPELLRQAVLDAVGQWVFRPFRVMGKPRQVEMELKSVFTYE